MNMRKSWWPVYLNLVGLVVFFIALQWNSFNMPFERDEGEYAYSAWIMQQGHVPYRDSFLQKPPMIIYTYLLSQTINPDSVWPPRLLASLASLLTAMLIGWIAKELHGKRAGWLAVWMYLPMSMLPIFLPYAANTEKFLLLPLMAVLMVQVRHGSESRKRHWIIAGALAAIAVLYKQTALLPLGVIFAFWAVDAWHHDGRAALVAKKLAFALGGAIAVSVVALSYFIYKGAIRDLVECTIAYNYYYARVGGNRLQFFSSMMLFLAREWWILIPLLGWCLYRRPLRWLEISVLFATTLLIASADLNGHYYLLMVPFLAIIASSALDSFLSWFPGKIQGESSEKRLVLLIPGVVVLMLILPLRGMIGLQPNALADIVYWGNPFVESSIVAQRVRELVPANETLFVAGSEPQILFLAKRMSLTRFVIMYPLTMPTPSMARYQNEVKDALAKSPPTVVVFALTGTSWFYQATQSAGFRYYTERMLRSGDYALVGGYMRNGQRRGWVEPLQASEVPLCTLIILKRKQPSS
jgi:hypothetical protein